MRNLFTFIVLLLVIAVALRVEFIFTILYLVVAVYALSHVWVQRSRRSLSVDRRFVDRAFYGDRVTVTLQVRNTSVLPVPWLQLHESLPVRLTALAHYRQVLSLRSRENRRLLYTFRCGQRGYYPIGPLTLRTGDLLGMVRQRQGRVSEHRIIVYPRVVSMQKLGLPTRPSRVPLFEDPARVMGVRDYQRGDSPRRIHWTATASANRLLVKQYQPAVARETLICLDLDSESYGQRQRYTATELAIVIAASVANHIVVREGLPVGLATEAVDSVLEETTQFSLPPRSERAHLMSILEALARVQITSPAPLTSVLRRASTSLSWGATVLVITGRESSALFDSLVQLRHAGFAVALILVQPARPSADLQNRADVMHVPIYRVWQESDLEGWQ
jgi:uncharacterized protein (DUF58 family)